MDQDDIAPFPGPWEAANDDEDPWTELFGASLEFEEARDIDQVTAALKRALKSFPEPVEQPPEAYPIYAVSCLLRALLDAIGRLPRSPRRDRGGDRHQAAGRHPRGSGAEPDPAWKTDWHHVGGLRLIFGSREIVYERERASHGKILAPLVDMGMPAGGSNPRNYLYPVAFAVGCAADWRSQRGRLAAGFVAQGWAT